LSRLKVFYKAGKEKYKEDYPEGSEKVFEYFHLLFLLSVKREFHNKDKVVIIQQNNYYS